MLVDLHFHTLFSDGTLLPSEVVCRAMKKKYKTIALTDHVDFSNMDFVIPRIVKISNILTKNYNITVIPGAELTYIPPNLISEAKDEALRLGAKLIVVHGETTAEVVPSDTNLKAILSKVDILAHPGRIEEDEVKLAKQYNVYLEITTRNLHTGNNEHVAFVAKKIGAKLILNSDGHSIDDFLDENKIYRVIKESGLSNSDFKVMLSNASELTKICLNRK